MSERIVFFGTPDFAVPSLRALAERFDVVCVVSQPDRPVGRGHQVRPTPVHAEADRLGLPVLQPQSAKELDLAMYRADLYIVVAYGQLLSKRLLEEPPLGAVNLHGSLLPRYRGAAPMQRAIEDGLAVSGVTTMQMNEGLDTGDILLTEEIPIAGLSIEAVHDLFAARGAELLVRTVEGLRAGHIVPRKQEDAEATYARKISREDYLFRPEQAVEQQLARLRAFGYLRARVGDRQCKIFSAKPWADKPYDPSRHLRLLCSDGWMEVTELQPDNAKRMSGDAFLRGHRIDSVL